MPAGVAINKSFILSFIYRDDFSNFPCTWENMIMERRTKKLDFDYVVKIYVFTGSFNEAVKLLLVQ